MKYRLWLLASNAPEGGRWFVGEDSQEHLFDSAAKWIREQEGKESVGAHEEHKKNLERLVSGDSARKEAQDNHGPCSKKDLLCEIIFNAQVLLHQELKSESAETKS